MIDPNLKKLAQNYSCDKLPDKNSFDAMYDYYKNKFKISENNIVETRRVIYRWAILLSRISAHPEYFYKIAQENLKYYYPNYKSNEEEKVKYLVLSSFLRVAQGKNCEVVKDSMREAYSISPKIFDQTLDSPFPFPERNINVRDIFRLSGLKVKNLNLSQESKKLCSH